MLFMSLVVQMRSTGYKKNAQPEILQVGDLHFPGYEYYEFMRLPKEKTLGIMLVIAMLLALSHARAQEQPQGGQATAGKPQSASPRPNLAEFIPLEAQLSGRLAALQKRIGRGLDVSAIEMKYADIESNVAGLADQVQKLRDSKDYRYGKLSAFRTAMHKEEKLLEEINEPLSEAILRYNTWRKDWLAEKKRWNEWRTIVLEEGAPDQINSTFARADAAIEEALDFIHLQLGTLLTTQQKAGSIQAKMYALAGELDDLLLAGRRSALLSKSPPMFSYQFVSQFGSELWNAVRRGLDEVSWPDSRFFAQQGWIVFLQVVFSALLIIALYRNRQVLYDSKRWRFLAARPFPAGLFIGFMTTTGIYEYVGVPAIWKAFNVFVCGISYARLSEGLIESSWKRHFVYGLASALIVLALVNVTSPPLPIVRLIIFSIATVGLFFCLRWIRESRQQEDSLFYTWSLRLGSLFLVFIIIAELWGKQVLAEYFFMSSMRTLAGVLIVMLFLYVVYGGLEWVFRISPVRHAVNRYSDPGAMIRRTARLFNITMALLFLPSVLMIWGVYDSFRAAVGGVWTFGFNVGSQRISVGLLIVAAGILYASFIVSWMLQKLLVDEVLVRRRVEFGVRLSIARLVHYVIILLGFLIAISALGFEVTKITIMLSALGVGIGFGLQGVVNNFVSGLILLFERPVREGDFIEFSGNWAEIKKIGLRATKVQTFDDADVIIPNADLVSNQVTNWTLSNRRIRIIIPVGVAYGSDVSLVMETLMASAKENPKVAKTPSPQVLFLNFGESSLDFELRVWVFDVNDMMIAKSELHQEIDRSFREKKIEIAFPQRDVHLRSLDEWVVSHTPKNS